MEADETEKDDLAPLAEEEASEGEEGHDEPEADQGDAYSDLSEDEETENPVVMAEQGEKLMDGGNLHDALDRYRNAVRVTRASGGDDTDQRVTLGDAYAYSGQGLNAYRQYRRAIQQSPRKAEPYFSST